MKAITPTALAALVVGAALALTGCASGSVNGGTAETPAPTGPSALDHVSVGLFPSSVAGVFQLGIDQGFFEDQGIEIEVVMAAGGAAHLPALSSGAIQFMVSSPVTPLTAVTQGLDVKITSGYLQNDPDVVEDSTVVVVGPGSTIQRAKDLEGKTVSVNALGSIGEIGIRELVAQDGGDPDAVNFVQLSLQEVKAQLEAGQIDAGMTGTPFMQGIVADGGRVLLDFIKETGVGGAELVVVANGALTTENPGLIERFNAALQQTFDLANEDNDAIRAILPGLLDIPEPAAAATVFGHYSTEIDEDALETFAELMLKHGVVPTLPDVSAAVWKP